MGFDNWKFKTPDVEFVTHENILKVRDTLPYEKDKEYTVVFSTKNTYTVKTIKKNWIPHKVKLEYYILLYKIKNLIKKI